MSAIVEKILCEFHREQTPSMAVYEDGSYFCFGCGAHGKPGTKRSVPIEQRKEKYVEPIEETITYIRGLPTKTIRGLSLPYDSKYYYIVWPIGLYYTARSWENDGPRYKHPIGHKQIPFVIRRQGSKRLFIVEGQLNALSIAEVISDVDIVSPGSAGELAKWSNNYLGYSEYTIIVDKDQPGIKAGLALREQLIKHCPAVLLKAMEMDANDMLVKRGKDVLLNEVR